MAIPNLAHDRARTHSTAGIADRFSRRNRGEYHASAALCWNDQEPTEHLSSQTFIDCDAQPRRVSLFIPLSLSSSVDTSLHTRDETQS